MDNQSFNIENNVKPIDKILIVDDIPLNIQVVANILSSGNYSLTYAYDGQSALNKAFKEEFDLILLDVMMPDMDGFSVCKELRHNEHTKDTPIIFLTVDDDTNSVVEGLEIGAMDYVTKPFNGTELLARVKTHLELHRSKKELLKINEKLKKEIKERLVAEKQYRLIYENAVQGMFQSALNGKIMNANPSYARILGYDSPKEIIESDGMPCFHPDDWNKIITELREKLILTNHEVKIKRRNGGSAWLLINVRLAESIIDNNKMIIEGIVVDNTARKLAEEELRRSEEKYRFLAVHDNLTGLYNTRYLYQALEDVIDKSSKENTPFSLIFMDIDDFKHVVDTYGHLNGSEALKEVAASIRECIAEPSYGVAYGGDEFVIVLPGFGKKEAMKKAGVIRKRMNDTVYLANKGHNVHIKASYGIATFPDDANDMTSLLTLADRAMFDVKAHGKDAIYAC